MDFNSGEILIIGLVALVVFGPRKLPELARKVGGWLREMRQVGSDFRHSLEAEAKNLKEPVEEIRDSVARAAEEAKSEIEDIGDIVEQAKPMNWVGPVPESGPTPANAGDDLDRIEDGEDLLGGEDPVD